VTRRGQAETKENVMEKREVAGPVAVAVAAAMLFIAIAAGWYLINREPTRVRPGPAASGIQRSTVPGRPNQAMPVPHQTLDKSN
jgi:hypothetical protein